MDTIHVVHAYKIVNGHPLLHQMIRCASESLAKSTAENFRGNHDGVVAYSRNVTEAGNRETRRFVLFRTGVLPEDVAFGSVLEPVISAVDAPLSPLQP